MKKTLFLSFLLIQLIISFQSNAQTCKAGTIKASHDTVCEFIDTINTSLDTSFIPRFDTLLVTGSTDSIQWQRETSTGIFVNIKGATDSILIDTITLKETFRVVAHNGTLCSDTSNIYFHKFQHSTSAYFYADCNGDANFTFHIISDTAISGLYHWDFGDGDTSNLSNPTHQYHIDSTFFACLTWYDDQCSSTYCLYIQPYAERIDCGGGIKTINNQNDWQMYPNPATDLLNFKSKSNYSGILKLIDLLGRVMYSTSFAPKSDLQVPINNLSKGVYILQVKEGYEVNVQKVVIQ